MQGRISKYNKYVVAEDFLLISNYNSVMEIPLFLSAVINTTSKEYLTEKKQGVKALAACLLLSGQRGVTTRARKSIAAFKLRQGSLIGCQTTMRKRKLYTIIDKLLVFALPRFDKENATRGLQKTSPLSLRREPKNSTLLQQKSKAVHSSTILQVAKILSQEEKEQLCLYLRELRERYNNKTTKESSKSSEGRVYNLAFGINNILLMPELQQFLPLFEGITGINLGVSFSNPKIKRSNFFFRQHSFFGKQKRKAFKSPKKALKKENEKHNKSQEQIKDWLHVAPCERHTLDTIFIPSDTFISKEYRKALFLTCFQYPIQCG